MLLEPIPGLIDYYADRSGNIYSTKRGAPKRLAEQVRPDGYVMVRLYPGRPVMRYVHRLITETFLLNWDSRLHCNHLDCNRQNNSVENLEACTQQENNIYRDVVTGIKYNESHHSCKFTDAVISDIKRLKSTASMSQVDIAKLYGISTGYLSGVLSGKARRYHHA